MLFKASVDNYINYLDICNYSQNTIIGYKKQLDYFDRFLGDTYNCPIYLKEITRNDIENYLVYMSKKGIASSSRGRYIYIMRAFYDYCTKNSLCRNNIASGIKAIKQHMKEKCFLAGDESERLISALDKPLMIYVVKTLLYSGMRISECLLLKKQDVDLKSKSIIIINGKGSKIRTIPICRKLMDILNDYCKSSEYCEDSPYFFATIRTGRLSPCYVNNAIREAAKLAGINKKVSAHTLRHTFASNLVRNNVNIVNIQKLLGHASLNATSIYTHSGIDDLSEAVNIL